MNVAFLEPPLTLDRYGSSNESSCYYIWLQRNDRDWGLTLIVGFSSIRECNEKTFIQTVRRIVRWIHSRATVIYTGGVYIRVDCTRAVY